MGGRGKGEGGKSGGKLTGGGWDGTGLYHSMGRHGVEAYKRTTTRSDRHWYIWDIEWHVHYS